MNCHHTIPAKECEICMGNPFHEVLTEEEIAHRKMWKKLNRKEKLNWIFNNLTDNPKATSLDRKQTSLPIVYEEE